MSGTDNRPATYQGLTVMDGVRSAAARTPDKAAVTAGARELNYRSLVDRSHRVANGLRDGLGLPSGTHIALLAPNCLEYVELVCGVAAAGCAVVTVSPRSPSAEVASVINDSEARVLFVHPDLEETARAASLDTVETVLVLGPEYETWLSRAHASRPAVVVEEWDTMVVHYTSGTTGDPKGVLVSHRSRVINYFAMASEYGCYGPDDRALAISPLYHGAGLSFALAPLFFGGTTTILQKFDPEKVLAELECSAATNVFMVPTHFNALFALGEDRLRNTDISSLKTVISNAAPLPQSIKERIVDVFGKGLLFECYGSTEAGVVSNLRPADQLRKERSVGLPFPCTEVRLLDDGDSEVKPGEVGELFSRSPYLFNGYWRRPEETAATMRDGWFSAGDLAHRDEEGYLYLVDRKGDRILSGGMNIYPREVEEALTRHPAVMEAAVYGIPDERWGELVHGSIVVRPGSQVAASELVEHCRTLVAGYKVPRGLDTVESLPRNAAGKVLRRALRDPYWEGQERSI